MADDIADMLDKARKGTLSSDDQRYQALERRASQGDKSAQNRLNAINRAGGAGRGSVNKVI